MFSSERNMTSQESRQVKLAEYAALRSEITTFLSLQVQFMSYSIALGTIIAGLSTKDPSFDLVACFPLPFLIFGLLYLDAKGRILRAAKYIYTELESTLIDPVTGLPIMRWELFIRNKRELRLILSWADKLRWVLFLAPTLVSVVLAIGWYRGYGRQPTHVPLVVFIFALESIFVVLFIGAAIRLECYDRKLCRKKPNLFRCCFLLPLTEADAFSQLRVFRHKLEEFGTLHIQMNENGVYSASASQAGDSPTGYQNAWLRDNAMIAFSRWQCGDAESAFKTLQGLTTFLKTQAKKMEAIIDRPELRHDVQQRPHVRFNAKTLKELDKGWSHAQNDALAYVVWLRLRLAASDAQFRLSQDERDLYDLFPAYFAAIRYWEDLDSGAWEEDRKVNSSSVGAVVAALLEFQKLEKSGSGHPSKPEWKHLDELISRGLQTLRQQLPFESPPNRETDAATLFLIYPLGLVGPSGAITDRGMQDWILSLVRARLVGATGIKRYIGDSYYCQDYDKWLSPQQRSGDFSDRIELRDELLQPGCEAQWCLFDPLLSVIYGQRNQLGEQIEFLNRALAQTTADGACPELYYLKNGSYVPNEHTPLAWTQANLAIAIHQLEVSLNRG